MSDPKIRDEKSDGEAKEQTKEYPPAKIVFPALAAIWLAFFLVALVGTP